MSVNWNDLSEREAEELLSTDFTKGLSQKAAKERYKHSGYNISLQKKKLQRADNTLDWFSFAVLLLISAVCYFVILFWKAVIFSLLSLSTILLLIIVDEYSKKKISSHVLFFASYVTVLRGGKQASIPSSFVVTGDVLKLKSGDTVPCDCYVIEKNDLKLSKKLSDTGKIISAKDVVESGTCTCVSIESASVSNKNTILDLQYNFITSSDIYKFSSRASAFALIIVSLFALITLFADILLKKETETVFFDFSSYFVVVCGVFVSCIPLLSKFFLTKFLLRNLEDNGVYIKNASALDHFAEIKCAVLKSDMFFSIDEPVPTAFYANNNLILSENVKAAQVRNSAFFDILLSTENSAASFSPVSKKRLDALQNRFGKELMSNAKLITYRLKDAEFPFDIFLFEENSGERYASVKGDLSSLIKCCTALSLGNKVISLDDGLKNTVLNAAAGLSSLGCEIVAYARNSAPDISLDNTHLSHKRLTFVGFAAYSKGQAESSDEFFSMCEQLDIEPVFIHYGTINELNMYMKGSRFFRGRSFVDCNKIGDGVEDIRNALSTYDGFLNPNERQYNALLKTLSQNGIKYAYISKQSKKSHAKEKKYFSLFFGDCADDEQNDINTECAMCSKSPSALASAISSAVRYKSRTFLILRFLEFLCFTKVFLMPIAIFTDNVLFTPLKTAFLVFVFDLISLFAFIDNKKIKDVSLEKKYSAFSFKAISVFALLTVITLFVSKLISLFDYGSELDILASVTFLVQIILPSLYLIFEEKLQVSEKLLIYLLSVLIFITLCVMFTPVGKFFGVISDVKILIASLITSITFFFIYCRYHKNTKNNI